MAGQDTRKPEKITKQINSLFSKLRQREDLVVVSTDKTNSVILMETSKYVKTVQTLLAKEAVPSTFTHLQEVHKKAKEKFTSIQEMNITISKVQSPNKRFYQCNFSSRTTRRKTRMEIIQQD